MSDKQRFPPQWPLQLLKLFIKDSYVEEIEGDMEEVFQNNLSKMSPKRARRQYTLETLKLLRPMLMKHPRGFDRVSQFTLFGNYYKTSVRSLVKNPLTSFINIFGLSAALGICLLVYTFLEYDRNIDQFHVNKDNVFLVTINTDLDGTMQQYGTTPRPLGEMLQQDFKEINKVSRVEDRSVIIKQDDNVFHERIRFVDPEFLQMFSFPLKWGTPASLTDLSTIILSEEMSIRYFGNENPVGREMLVIFNDQSKKVFTVGGVAMEFPKSHDIDFNFLVNYKNFTVANSQFDFSDWKASVDATFIQVKQPEDLLLVERGMDKYRNLQNKAQSDWVISSFSFQPLSTLFRNSVAIKNCISNDYNVEGRIGMPVIAIFMLFLACFNYINIAIVSASKRLKEIGVRKAIGANRMKVVVQFLTENMVITSFALLIGLALSVLVFIPWFVQFTGWPLEAKLLDQNIWIFLGGLLLFVGLASGIYPALYISKFDAIRIFKGSLEFGRKNPLTKVFLGVQLILACITITAGVVFTQNNAYQRNRSWGYNQHSALYVRVPDQVAFERMKAAVIQNPNIIAMSGSADHLGKNYSTSVIHTASNQFYEVDRIKSDPTYAQTMQLTLLEGRFFREFTESDKRAMVVNEQFVKNLKLENPIGAQFELDSMKFEVVGVIRDFHNQSFFQKIKPTIFTVAEESDYRYLTFRVKAGSEESVHASLQTNWSKLYPEFPFQGGYQEDVWTNYFHSLDRSVSFNRVIAMVALLLASLGLYGLVRLNVSGRVREFSIRKTFGANTGNILYIIIKQYLPLIVVALAIGAPVSYLFTKAYLNMLFSYSMPMGYSGVIIAVIFLVGVLLAIISSQVRKVVKADALEGLKSE